jgi:hypothetical protein
MPVGESKELKGGKLRKSQSGRNLLYVDGEITVGERESPRSGKLKKPKSERHLSAIEHKKSSRSDKMTKSKSERRVSHSGHKRHRASSGRANCGREGIASIGEIEEAQV